MHLRGVLVFTSAVFAFVSVSRAQVYEPNLGKSGARPDVVAPGLWEVTAPTNSSLPSNGSALPGGLLEGFCFLGVSILGFGSSMVPMRSLDVGDGMFFQLVFCSTMGMEALLVFLIRGCPEIWPLSLLSSLLYNTGNLLSAPIIKTIGLGVGTLIWSVFSLLFAWATARFGWFGIDPQQVPNATLNYVGTAVLAISAVILFFLKTDETPLQKEEEENEERKPLLRRTSDTLSQLGTEHETLECPTSWSDRLSPVARRILGSVLAVFSGLCYGSSYTPIIYIKNSSLKNVTHFQGASQFDVDYLFPQMIGVNALTTVAFLVYCCLLKNRPHLPPNCVVPAFIGGSLQFLAYYAFFEACYHLGTLITYPIGTTCPALISLLWSVFYFKELKGIKNFIILASVLIAVVCGVILITLSKVDP